MENVYLALFEVQECALLAGRAFRRLFFKPFYFQDGIMQMDIVGVGSLPIVCLAGFSIGMVLALNTASTLQSFGAQNFTGQLVVTSLIRELAPVLTSIMVAGRIGSGIAAELGSMLVSDQIDAMRAMGTDPIKKLVGPRLLACIAMTPALTIVFTTVGTVGGWVIARTLLGLETTVYSTSAREALNYTDLAGMILKSITFGGFVAIIGCRSGLRTHGGTVGVGRSTTQSVVASIVTILVSDFFLTKLILAFRNASIL